MGKLSVTLNVPMVYGQIATPSKVPALWVVSNPFEATVEPNGDVINVRTKGLFTEVPAQALETYEKIMREANLLGAAAQYESHCEVGNQKKCGDYLEAERKATMKWIKKNSGTFATSTGKKISKVVKAAIGIRIITWDNWGSILYSMISGAPRKINNLIFDKAGKTVVAESELWDKGSVTPLIKKYGLVSKAEKIGSKALTECPGWISGQVASNAKSGWGFGMLFGFGNPNIAGALSKFDKASPALLVNLFSLCKKGADDADPPCTGNDHGRIHWTAKPTVDFT